MWFLSRLFTIHDCPAEDRGEEVDVDLVAFDLLLLVKSETTVPLELSLVIFVNDMVMKAMTKIRTFDPQDFSAFGNHIIF